MMHLAELAGRQAEWTAHREALRSLRRMRATGRINPEVYRTLRGRHLGWLRRQRAKAREGAAA